MSGGSGRLIALAGATAPLGTASGRLLALAIPASLLVLLAVLLLSRRLAKAIAKARPLEPGDLLRRLAGLADRAGVAVAELLVLPEPNSANARLLGLTDRTRCVVFTKGLLAKFAPREVEAAFAHEIGHARRGHPRWILLLIAAFLLLSYPIEKTALGLPVPFGVPLVLAFFLAWWRFLYGWISRRFELEADLEAAELIGAEPYQAGLSSMEEAGGTASRSFRHPSLEARREHVRACAGPGPSRRAFEGRGLFLRRLLFGLLAASAAAFGASLAAKVSPPN